MDPPALAAERRLGFLNSGAQDLGTGGHRHMVERFGEGRPIRLLDRARGELVQRFARDGAKAVGVDIVERQADDPTTGNEAGCRQVEQTRQQLAFRKIAGGAHQHNDLGIFRTYAWRNLCQGISLVIVRRRLYRTAQFQAMPLIWFMTLMMRFHMELIQITT